MMIGTRIRRTNGGVLSIGIDVIGNRFYGKSYNRTPRPKRYETLDIPEKYRVVTTPQSYNSGTSAFPVQTRKQVAIILADRRQKFQRMKNEAKEMGLEFDLQASSVIERLPVIIPDMEDWEANFRELSAKRALHKNKEYGSKLLNVPDVHRREDDWVYEMLTYGTGKIVQPMPPNVDMKAILESIAKQKEATTAANDLKNKTVTGVTPDSSAPAKSLDDLLNEDDGDNEFELQLDNTSMKSTGAAQQNFVPEPRITEEDLKNDTHSIRRKLARRTHLIVKVDDVEGGSKEPVWRFYSDSMNDGERLLNAATRIMESSFGGDMELYYQTRAPCGVHYTKYSPEMQKKTGKYGAQVFFIRGQRITGHVKVTNSKIRDYAWITSDDLDDFVPQHETDPYWSYASMFLDD